MGINIGEYTAGRETKVPPSIYLYIMGDFIRGAMDGIIVVWIDRFSFLDIPVISVDIDLDELIVLSYREVFIVIVRQVNDVLSIIRPASRLLKDLDVLFRINLEHLIPP